MDRPKLSPFLKSLPLVTLAAFASACGDAATDPDEGGGELTEAEALALAGQLGLESMAFGRSSDALPAPGPASGPLATTVSVTYDLTRPCFLGGSVRSSGRIDVESDDASQLAVVDITATEIHQRCVFLAGSTRVTVTGDPSVTTTIHVASLGQEPLGTQSVSVLGGLLFETDDGRSGHCDVDVLVQVDQQEATTVTRGEVCGFSFDVTVQG